MSKFVIDQPDRVLIPDGLDQDRLRHYLSFKDKSVQFELMRLKRQPGLAQRWGQEYYDRRIEELKAQSNRCLLIEKDGLVYTYSGLARELSEFFKLPLENQVVYPEPQMIPWAKVPDKTMRPYQEEALQKLLEAKHGAVQIGCHRKGERVLMFDGTLKAVEDVEVGDRLMGPDSFGRNVLELKRGQDEMYCVETVNRQKMYVNGHHLLVLRRTNRSGPPPANGKSRRSDYRGTNPVMVIPVREYVKKSNKFKHLHKLFSASIEFPDQCLPVDPYFLGVLLGDGSLQTSIGVTTMDIEIVDLLQEQSMIWGVPLIEKKKATTEASTYFFSTGRGAGKLWNRNPLKEAIRGLKLLGTSCHDKFIPQIYKTNSTNKRLQVLAGLIDTDGSLTGGCYDFISKSKILADDICFLTRSLGLRASLVSCKKRCQTGAVGEYWRVTISGDLSRIPVRVARKIAAPRLQKKNPLSFGFTVTKLSDSEDYFGFVLDQDHLYLTDTFLVTHNTGLGKSLILLHLIKSLGLVTIIVTPSISIASQLYDLFKEAFGTRYVGMFGDGKKQFKKRFVIALAQSLTRLEPGDEAYEVLSKAQVLAADESHLLPATTFEKVFVGVGANAPYRFSFSATQTRTDGAELLLKGLIGPVVYNMSVEEGVQRGYLARPVFKMIRVTSENRLTSDDANEMDRAHLLTNPTVLSIAAEIANHSAAEGKPVLILLDEFEQAALLDRYLRYPREFAHGGMRSLTPKERNRQKRDPDSVKDPKDFLPEKYWKSDVVDQVRRFNEGAFPILLGTSAIGLGTDILPVQTLIIIRKGTSEIKFAQSVGRGTRMAPGKTSCLVFDFDVVNIPIVHRHATARAEIYNSILEHVSYLDMTRKYVS